MALRIAITHLGSAIDVLKGAEDGDGFVSAVEIQRDVGDRRTIQASLTIKRFSHRLYSSKIWTCRRRFSQRHSGCGTKSVQSSRSIFAQSPVDSSAKRILRRTLTTTISSHNHGGGILQLHWRSSAIGAVKEVLPRYDWKDWLFPIDTSQRFWQDPKNHRSHEVARSATRHPITPRIGIGSAIRISRQQWRCLPHSLRQHGVPCHHELLAELRLEANGCSTRRRRGSGTRRRTSGGT